MNNVSNAIKLCLVTNRLNRSHQWLADIVKKAVLGGITMVQLREKNLESDQEFIDLANLLLKTLENFNIPLIINDRVDICQIVNAHGVHLGQDDIHPDDARKILGKNAIIGLSLESLGDAHLANKLESIDYVAASHVFSSRTKPNKTNPIHQDIWGIEGLKQLYSISKYPIISIGGIDASNAAQVIEAGSSGIAVVSAILESKSPELSANELINIINIRK